MNIISKLLDKFFGEKVETSKESNSERYIREEEERFIQHRNEYQKLKEEWEKKNEKAKKIDSCNLNCTHTAFQGTYEEWINKNNLESMAKLQHSYYANLQNGCNPYQQQQVQLSAATGLYCNRNGFFG